MFLVKMPQKIRCKNPLSELCLFSRSEDGEAAQIQSILSAVGCISFWNGFQFFATHFSLHSCFPYSWCWSHFYIIHRWWLFRIINIFWYLILYIHSSTFIAWLQGIDLRVIMTAVSLLFKTNNVTCFWLIKWSYAAGSHESRVTTQDSDAGFMCQRKQDWPWKRPLIRLFHMGLRNDLQNDFHSTIRRKTQKRQELER